MALTIPTNIVFLEQSVERLRIIRDVFELGRHYMHPHDQRVSDIAACLSADCLAVRKSHLIMTRPNLLGLPALPELPAGYLICECGPADADELARLLSAAFEDETWTSLRVDCALLAASDVIITFGIRHKHQIVATASLRHMADRYPHDGYVHWVASDPEHRGKNLGRIVSLAVLYAAHAHSFGAAWLERDDFRLADVRTYLYLGFQPFIESADHTERWLAVMRALGRDDLGRMVSIDAVSL